MAVINSEESGQKRTQHKEKRKKNLFLWLFSNILRLKSNATIIISIIISSSFNYEVESYSLYIIGNIFFFF